MKNKIKNIILSLILVLSLASCTSAKNVTDGANEVIENEIISSDMEVEVLEENQETQTSDSTDSQASNVAYLSDTDDRLCGIKSIRQQCLIFFLHNFTFVNKLV